jgi:cobalamin biosynthesis Mg chelatase CobN
MVTKAARTPRTGMAGIGVDAFGDAAFDPTANVKALVIAESRRQDDLRAAAKELSDVKHTYEQTIGKLREDYQEKIQRAESGRLDSIRQVDREEVAKTAVAANTAITTLAKQTNDLAVTLAKTVADTAAAAEARNSAQYSDTNKRLSALELSSSEGKGKQTVADPQMEKLTALVETLARTQATGAGQSQGMSDSVKLLVTILTIVTLLLGFYSFTQRGSTPQIIYTPAPPGTQLPATVPR